MLIFFKKIFLNLSIGFILLERQEIDKKRPSIRWLTSQIPTGAIVGQTEAGAKISHMAGYHGLIPNGHSGRMSGVHPVPNPSTRTWAAGIKGGLVTMHPGPTLMLKTLLGP